VGGALVLDRCRAFDLFASVDSLLCMIVRAEGHVSEVEGGPVGNSNADRGGCGGDARGRAGKHIRHDVRRAWYEHKDAWVLRYECQVALFAARC
jgi:hypothetical protein